MKEVGQSSLTTFLKLLSGNFLYGVLRGLLFEPFVHEILAKGVGL